MSYHVTLTHLAFAAALLLPAAAPGESTEADQEVRVRKVIVHCEGEDCPDEHHGLHPIVLHHGGEHFSHTWLGAGDAGRGGFLGVGLTELTPELRRHFGVPEEAGVLVSRVIDDSAAARAGLRVGDIIAAVDGEPASSGRALARAIHSRDEGESVVLEVWRDGTMETVTATLEEREAPAPERHIKVVRCAGGEGDCPHHGEIDRLCSGSEDCRVEIRCEGGECTCTVDGEAVECGGLGAFADD